MSRTQQQQMAAQLRRRADMHAVIISKLKINQMSMERIGNSSIERPLTILSRSRRRRG
jgi:hypothetical protein